MSKSDHGGTNCMASEADMFDEGSLVLALLVVLNMVGHSGISKHELRR